MTFLAQFLKSDTFLIELIKYINWRAKKNHVSNLNLQKKFDTLASKLSIDPDFAGLFIRDFEYAKLESAKLGLDIDVDLYRQLVESYIRVEAASLDFLTFEDGWQNPFYKSGRSNVPRLTKIIILSSILGASIGGLFLLKKFQRNSYKK